MSRCTPFVLLLALWAGHAQAADLAASIDRSRVNSGETVELTIESNDVTQFGKPDLAPLDPLFDVRGTRQINQLTTLDGSNHATTRWIITLQPKTTGTVVIPPLQLGELKTQGWPVMARCLTCSLEMDVKLDVLMRERGAELSLWGRSARCRSRGIRHCDERRRGPARIRAALRR